MHSCLRQIGIVPLGAYMPGTMCAQVTVRINGSNTGVSLVEAIQEEEPT